MNSFLGLENIPARAEFKPGLDTFQPPRLLLQLEPRGRAFARNLADFLLRRRPPAIRITSPPAAFWPDVFVPRPLPWGAFAESILYHGIVFVIAWGYSSLVVRPQPKVQVRRFDPADVIYYSPLEYLPPLDTGNAPVAKPLKGDPEFARQPILSVPPESDNRHQTIVTPPDIKLTHDVDIPNIVAWGDHSVPVPAAAIERKPSQLPALPSQIVAPVPDLTQSSKRNLDSLSEGIVAPPPEIKNGVRAVASLSIDVVAPAPDASVASTRRTLRGPESSVVEPPPALSSASVRKLGDINVGRSDVIAPAPQLPVTAQRTLSALGGGGGKAVVPPPPSDAVASGGTGAARSAHAPAGLGSPGAQVVPPPPSVQSGHSVESGGRIIALGIHPSVTPPPEPPQGNRRGTFAATPEGKAGAAGTPDLRAANSSVTDGHGMEKEGTRGGAGSGSESNAGAPPGLYVGAAKRPASAVAGDDSASTNGGASGNTRNPGNAAVASARLPQPHSGSPQPRAVLVDNPSQLDRRVFRDRRLYSMTLNMPNLNSAGGSWVIRFAELDNNREQGELLAPVADHKVDPAYPLQLMRENVSGTVTLRAIIRADGTVSDIRVVNGADSRLDHYASQAFARWHFQPAMKNDSTVDVEAIVMIPFKPILRRSPF